MAIFGLADEKAFLCGAIVIGLAERAAAVGHEGSVFEGTLCEPVEMPTKSGLQVVLFEHFEHIFSVFRAHLDGFAEREMGEGDERPVLADFFGGLGQETDGWLVNSCLVSAHTLGAIEANELPAFVVEVVIEAIGKNGVVARPIGLSEVIVISRNGVKGNSEAAENFLYGAEFLFVAMMGEVTGNEAEVGLRTGFDLLEHTFEEGGAFFVNEMDVVDGGETEIAGTGFALGAQCSRPKTH